MSLHARWYFWFAFGLVVLATLVGCGGGDTKPADHWLLIMETTARQPEAIFVYDSANDCTAAGSYRLFSAPEKYIGYACKEV